MSVTRMYRLCSKIERFMRYSPGFDGTLATVCAPGPVKTARSCAGGGRRGRYTRPERRTASRRAQKSSYQSLYFKRLYWTLKFHKPHIMERTDFVGFV